LGEGNLFMEKEEEKFSEWGKEASEQLKGTEPTDVAVLNPLKAEVMMLAKLHTGAQLLTFPIQPVPQPQGICL
jgi:hypothetical protein